MFESLHQCDQGIFSHMMDLLRTHIGKTKLSIVEQRMQVLSKSFWISHLTLPTGRFWVDRINIQGHEYRDVMQVRNTLIVFINKN